MFQNACRMLSEQLTRISQCLFKVQGGCTISKKGVIFGVVLVQFLVWFQAFKIH